MDFDGFLALMNKDFEKFESWEKNANTLSINELLENYNHWSSMYNDALKRYWDFENKETDVSAFMGKMGYLHHLSRLSWSSLKLFTDKILEENKNLKAPKPVTKKSTKKTKKNGLKK